MTIIDKKGHIPIGKKGHTPWNKTDIMVLCDYCKKPFRIEPWRLKAYKKHYCNVACCSKDQCNRITVKCDYCEKIFEITPWRLKYKNHYCSRICSYKGSLNNFNQKQNRQDKTIPENYNPAKYKLQKEKNKRKIVVMIFLK